MVPQNNGGGPTLKFLRNPSGVLLIVNFVSDISVFCLGIALKTPQEVVRNVNILTSS